MLPYFELRRVHIAGGVSIEVFGTLVVTGVAAGLWFARRRARATGIPPQEISSAAAWAVGVGFASAHIVEMLLYRPDELARRPLALLEFWNGLSSFGGFFGALLGLAIHFGRSHEPWLRHADALLQGLVVGWVFGRLGCTLVHDHVGARSDFALAIQFPDGPRHDLGLYELVFTVSVLLPALWVLNRRPRPPGAAIAVLSLLYAPARFLADFLRATDVPGADLRYAGLTPAQYGCLLAFGIGIHLARRAGRRRPAPRRRE